MRDSWACTAFLFEEGSLATSSSLFMGYYSEDWMHLGGHWNILGGGEVGIKELTVFFGLYSILIKSRNKKLILFLIIALQNSVFQKKKYV